MQRLLSLMRKANNDYHLIEDGDKIAIGISGGKDSIALLAVLNAYRRFSPEKFDIVAINIDMGFEETDCDEVARLKAYAEEIGVPLIIEKTDIAKIIFEERKEESPCSLCSKMRRGALNTVAIKNGCNKIALGHHSDDIIETFFLSFIYEGRLSTFMPKSYMDRTGITLIRPLIYVEEKQIIAFQNKYSLPIVHNPCPQDKHTKRQDMKELIDKIDKDFGHSKVRMLRAIFHPERNNLFDKSLK